MFADRKLSPPWLQLHAMPSKEGKVGSIASATPVPEERELLDITTFTPWVEMDENAVEVGQVLSRLPENDRHRDILSESIDYSNKYVGSLSTKYDVLSKRAGVGDEDAANAFSELITVASKALRVPDLRKGILCEPWQIEKKSSERICCSLRTESRESAIASESSVDSNITDEGSTTKPVPTRVVKPDITLYSTFPGHGKSGMPIIAVEGKKPLIRFAVSLRGNCDTKTSADKMVQSVLERVREERSILQDEEMIFYLALCQSLVYALQTESQSAILTNHNETFFLRISKLSTEFPQEITVAISSLYDEKTLLCGLIAFIRKSFSEDYNGTVDWRQRTAFLRSLSAEDPDYVPDLLEMEGENGSVDYDESFHEGGTMQGYQTSHSVPVTCTQITNEISEKQKTTAGNSIHVQSPNSVVRANHRRGTRVSGYALARLMDHNFGFISTSGYNRVLLCRLADQRFVAVKYFYSLEEKTVPSQIEHEVRMHSLLQQRCPSGEYGDFLSELLAYGYLKSFGMVIMTAYVGHSVSRSGSKVIVGEQCVSDVDGLIHAAVWSLARIHKAGILHGDVSLRNVRARRAFDGRWNVWWLDLGDAKESERIAAFREEIRDCLAMFQGVE